MLTKTNPDGTLSCQGIDFKELPDGMYGVLCKLRDYEASGFEPSDLDKVKENVHIGLSICKYIVVGVWNGYCIAENPSSPYPYVVWRISADGYNVYEEGSFTSRAEAEKKFSELAFDAVPDKTEYWKR